MREKGQVYFVGAGPGDPDLLTVKGRKLVSEADVVIYAGSLVQEKILAGVAEHAELHNSAGLGLALQIKIMEQAVNMGKSVVRLQTGDPSVYGAIAEQMRALDRLHIDYRVVPGVSAAFAAAAALKIELTVPEHTQTVILTRLSGRTSVPDKEKLAELAAHRTSLMIFLSTGMIERVVAELQTAGYADDTPVAVVFKVTWPDEKIIRGCIRDIARKVLAEEVTHHAIIVVSPVLQPALSETVPPSHLYGAAQAPVLRDRHTAILTLTRGGLVQGKRLLAGLQDSILYAPERLLEQSGQDTRVRPTVTSIRQTLQSAFKQHKALVCIMSSGIVVREIAPLLVSKQIDPAVIIVDEAGKFAFSLLSGHKGGANALARQCASLLGGQAVITTASDTQGLPALDLLAQQNGWTMDPAPNLTALSAAMVNDEPLGIYQDCGTQDWLPQPYPDNFKVCRDFDALLDLSTQYVICITYRDVRPGLEAAGKKALVLHPACLYVGVGCNRGMTAEEIVEAIKETFAGFELSLLSIASLASIDLKQDEAGLLAACEANNWPLHFFSAAEISTVKNLPNPSDNAEKYVGAAGVAEPAAALAAKGGRWLVEKQKFPNVTVAVALEEGV